MKNIKYLYDYIGTEQNPSVRRSNRLILYTLINYLEANRKGISKFEMDNFLNGNTFSGIFQEFLDKSIIGKSENGNYQLNVRLK